MRRCRDENRRSLGEAELARDVCRGLAARHSDLPILELDEFWEKLGARDARASMMEPKRSLLTQSSAPSCLPRSSFSRSPRRSERRTVCVLTAALLRRCSTSNPDMLGMLTSHGTRSGVARTIDISPSRPLQAALTSKPWSRSFLGNQVGGLAIVFNALDFSWAGPYGCRSGADGVDATKMSHHRSDIAS
jgi:hypothetical protein